MPRPRTPLAILRLNGALERNPGRYADRLNEPRPNGPIGPAPKWLNAAERRSWDWIVSRSPVGVLSDADEGIVELAACLRAAVVKRTATSRDIALLRQCYGELGMTPAGRTKVGGARPPEPTNRFAAI